MHHEVGLVFDEDRRAADFERVPSVSAPVTHLGAKSKVLELLHEFLHLLIVDLLEFLHLFEGVLEVLAY